MAKQRIYLWDNLKFLLIIFVVMGHFLVPVSNSDLFKSLSLFIYTFHMPMFIFISGLFHKNNNITNKVFTFISIGFLIKIAMFFTETYICGNSKAVFNLLAEDHIPWFMFSLAFFILITYLLKNIEPKKIIIISILMSLFVHYDKNIGDFLILARITYFFPFYYIGTIINKEKLSEYTNKKICRFLGIIIILTWLFLCIFNLNDLYFFRFLAKGNEAFSDAIYNYGFILQFISYIISILMGFALICITPNRQITLITKFGQRTIQVYFWHYLIILFLINNLDLIDILCINPIGKIIYLLLSIILTFILSTKIFSFPTSIFLNNKE